MSPAGHDSFVVIFGVVGVGHLALAWLTWQRNARRWRDSHTALTAEYGQEATAREYRRTGGPFPNQRERMVFNSEVALGVFFGLLCVVGGLGLF